MNKRRKLVLALGVGAIGPFASFAQQGKPVRVGILVGFTATKFRSQEKIFTDSLRDYGWIEGSNVVYDRAYADDDESRLPALAEGLVKRNANLIFAPYNVPLAAAHARSNTIPIVFSTVNDPLGRRFVKSFAHPGGNITGVANIGYELGGKRMQLLKQALPKVSRVGVLMHSTSPDGPRELKLIEEAADSLRVKVIPAKAQEIWQIETAFSLLVKNRVEALLATHVPLFISGGRKHLLAFAASYRLPVMGAREELPENGGLMSYGSRRDDQTRRAAQLADKILRGAKPADIPIEQPTTFEFVVNKITAKALGITFPAEIMLQATRVIE